MVMIGNRMFRRGFFGLMAMALANSYASTAAVAQPAQATPAPSASTVPSASPAAPFDINNLTPDQQKALQLAIIKTSQNPVGNITVVPLQNNFNYGVGPYARFQYNLNIQPVFPIMLSSSWNLISRTIIPILNQPSAASPAVCATPLLGCPWTLGLSDVQQQFSRTKNQAGSEILWGVGPIFRNSDSGAKYARFGKVVGRSRRRRTNHAGQMGNRRTWDAAMVVRRHAEWPNVSSSLVQPFVNYNLKDGWAISTAPIMTVNSTLPGTKWTVPVGGGVAKTFKYNGQLMSVGLLYYTNVVRAAGSPQTTLRVWRVHLAGERAASSVQQLLQEAK